MTEPQHSADRASDLLSALESARTKLSIAIAAESKTTTPASRRQYLATAERISRFVRNFRKRDPFVAVNYDAGGLIRELRRQIEAEPDVRRLCQILEDMVSELE